MVTAIRSHIFRIGLAPSLPGIRALQQKEEDSVCLHSRVRTQRGALLEVTLPDTSHHCWDSAQLYFFFFFCNPPNTLGRLLEKNLIAFQPHFSKKPKLPRGCPRALVPQQ